MRTLPFVFGTALLLSSSLVGCASADDDASSGQSSDDNLLAGHRLTANEVAGHLISVGFVGHDVLRMVCTAQYESSFFERAQNKNRDGSIDRGLFQINDVHLGQPGCPQNAEQLFDAHANVQCARAIFNKEGIRAWYGYQRHVMECEDYDLPQ